jgi:hypothetical protein
MKYIISYDQHRDRDYTPVWTQLNSWGAKRVLESVWLLASSLTAQQIRDQLQTVTRKEDSLLVVELKPGSNWGTYQAQTPGVQWLQQNIAA